MKRSGRDRLIWIDYAGVEAELEAAQEAVIEAEAAWADAAFANGKHIGMRYIDDNDWIADTMKDGEPFPPEALEAELPRRMLTLMAEAARKVIQASAIGVWYTETRKANGKGERIPTIQIPSDDDIRRAVDNADSELQAEVNRRLTAANIAAFKVKAENAPPDKRAVWRQVIEAERGLIRASGMWQYRAADGAALNPSGMIWTRNPDEQMLLMAIDATDAKAIDDARTALILRYAVGEFGTWCAAEFEADGNPIAPIVKEAIARLGVEPDRRRNVIAPYSLKQARLIDLEELPRELGEARRLGKERDAQLPLWNDERRAVIPRLPIEVERLYNLRRDSSGRGAPMAERLLFEMLMSVRRELRGNERRLNITLRDLTEMLWRKGGWRPSRQLNTLRRELMILHNLRISYERAEWSVINVRKLPEESTRPDDVLAFDVYSIGDSGRGPLINRVNLRELGRTSAPAWRSYLRLAYVWDEVKMKRGGRRLHATRPEVKRGRDGVILDKDGKPVLKRGGVPVKDWSDPRADLTGRTERNPAADAMPEFGPDELIALCYDDDTVSQSARRDRLKRARNALLDMEQRGMVVIEKDGRGGWRILEPWRNDDDGAD